MEIYDYNPPSITPPLRGKEKVKEMEEHIDQQQGVLQLLIDNLDITKNRMKQQAYRHCNEMEIEVGEWVFLVEF
jgi:hypothetical protein